MKAAVVYWSMTGNTETMANAIAEGAGTTATEWSDFSGADVDGYDALAFGCPAMGDEELDPDFKEMWEECVPNLRNKPVVLFGSYDWGTGDWMETWASEAQDADVNVVDTLIVNLTPDDDALASCKELGKKLVG